MTNTKSILLVEDDTFIATAYKDGLEREGLLVNLMTDGQEALVFLEKNVPDVILLDIILPVMDGFEVLETIKADDRLKDVPVVILSNLGQESDIERGKKLGAEDYLVKSDHTLAEVVKVVKSHLEK